MNNKVVLETDTLSRLFEVLNVNELKLTLVLIHYAASKNTRVFINNAENREYLASEDFKRTPVRISHLLSSLVNKGIIKREGLGVFSIPETLCSITMQETSDKNN